MGAEPPDLPSLREPGPLAGEGSGRPWEPGPGLSTRGKAERPQAASPAFWCGPGWSGPRGGGLALKSAQEPETWNGRKEGSGRGGLLQAAEQALGVRQV